MTLNGRKRAPPLHGQAMQKRDEDIFLNYHDGASADALGAKYGLAPTSVIKIAQMMRAKANGTQHTKKRHWLRSTRERYRKRDKQILIDFDQGVTRDALAAQHHLSVARISNIILEQQKERDDTMHKHRVLDAVEEQAARYGFFKHRLPPDYRQVAWRVECSRCHGALTANWGPGMNPEGMAKFSKQKGWDVGLGDSPLCPGCKHKPVMGLGVFKPQHTLLSDRLLDAAAQRSQEAQAHQPQAEEAAPQETHLEEPKPSSKRGGRRSRESVRKGVETAARRRAEQKARQAAEDEEVRQLVLKARAERELGVTVPTPVHSSPPQPAPVMHTHAQELSPKAYVAVVHKLDQVFDKTARRYQQGYTDLRVAEECGAVLAQVVELRTLAYGELAEDPRIAGLRDDVMQLTQLLQETMQRLNEVTRS